jgi:hypothetical protein
VLAFPINPLRSHITIEFNQNYPEFRPIIDNLWDFILATVNDKTPQDKITPLYKNEKPKIEPIKSDLPDNTSIELDDLQMAGLAWIDRDRSVGDRSDFLKIWQDPDLGRKYHTVDDLKKICHQLCEIGLCEMGSNRRWKLTKTGKQLVRVYKLSPSFT